MANKTPELMGRLKGGIDPNAKPEREVVHTAVLELKTSGVIHLFGEARTGSGPKRQHRRGEQLRLLDVLMESVAPKMTRGRPCAPLS